MSDRRPATLSLIALLFVACSGEEGEQDSAPDDSTSTSTSSTGDGDGDPSTTGDGDGDPSTTGDGDGDDPSTTGDGDGDDPSTTGDGDGDPPAGDCEVALEGWELVWCDDFASIIDPAKWAFEISADGGGNNELQYYTDRPENARIEDGQLVIEARAEEYTDVEGTRDYTSARLRSFELAEWTYGRIEARIRVPEGQGLWPAFWMLPTDWVYGGWAASGEIDIMELVGHQPNTVYGTLHYGGMWPNNTSSAGGATWGTHDYVLDNGDFSEGFHEFAIEWEAEEIRWYVDGVHFQTQTQWWSEAGPYPAPFDQDFHLLLNVAVGGNWPGAPDDTTVFPQTMRVDWVRVYQPS